MKEIGGYFGLEENSGKEYYQYALAFNTARNCLRFLMRHYGIKRIAIPDYDCGAVENAINKEYSGAKLWHIQLINNPDKGNCNTLLLSSQTTGENQNSHSI